MEIKFIIDGEARGKGRPRATVRGGIATIYTPKETVDHEKYIKIQYKRQKGVYFADKPLIMDIKVYTQIPKNVSKIQKEKMLDFSILPTKKPDLDNIAKLILDALNDTAYADDKQIIALSLQKFYAEKAYTEVRIEDVELANN